MRVVPATCNNEINKQKRKRFGDALVEHERAGHFLVFMDETNFNIFYKRSQGRARKGERAVVMLPPSKGANLQVQCAVTITDGLLLHRFERGSNKMEQTAAFLADVYGAAKASPSYVQHFAGKKAVIVLDNAPAHQQAEFLVPEHEDLEPQ